MQSAVSGLVSDESFDLIEKAVASGGAASALDLLAQKFITEKQYPQLFYSRRHSS